VQKTDTNRLTIKSSLDWKSLEFFLAARALFHLWSLMKPRHKQVFQARKTRKDSNKVH